MSYMKFSTKYILIPALFGLLMLGTGCSDSWLQTEPTDQASNETILSSTENAKKAINGLCKLMTMQHGAYWDYFANNGEGTVIQYYLEYPGRDFNYPLMSPGWSVIFNNKYTQNVTSGYCAYPWYYYYSIVGNANTIIANIDNAEGEQNEKDYIKAGALTFRAYAFLRLSQIYCDSWKESNNGATEGIVLRLDESTGDLPLSTLAQTYEQIYSDLEKAISLFKSNSNITRDSFYDGSSVTCYPDLNVASAILARAALSKNDYQTALDNAHAAREGRDLMSNADYKGGFFKSNSEWIWGTFNDAQETLYYGAFLVTFARNGYYATKNHYHVCVARDYIDAIADSDIRKGLFLHQGTFLPEGKTINDVLDTETSSQVGMFTEDEDGDEAYNKAETYIKENFPDMSATPYNAYTSLKYACEGMPGIGSIPLIRSSEMLLIEAEANYFLHTNNPTLAQNSLIALNKTSGRDPNYTCNLTGEQLFEEIAKYRRLELWGEGHSWLDCKRWGIPVVRKTFTEGGNYDASVSGTFGYVNGECIKTFWKWSIPVGETDLNGSIK